MRVPVCWDGHTGEEAPYTIDKAATTTHAPATGTGTLTFGRRSQCCSGHLKSCLDRQDFLDLVEQCVDWTLQRGMVARTPS